MLKRIDRVVLGSFILPLIITFGLTSFIFMMQFLWKYIDDIVGKGIELALIAKLVGLFTLTITPMALPLAILLASTMVIGNLGENNELTAYKSGGLSLLRIMGSLIVFSIFLAGLAFYFSDNILPKVHLKFYSLLFDIRKQKPALDITEGVFYRGISGFAIKVNKKEADNKTLHDIMVYDHSDGKGNDNIVLAKKGDIALSNSGQFLILTLFNGKQYQDIKKRVSQTGEPQPEQTIMEFKQWRKVFDLTEFKMSRTDESLFKSHYMMYNSKQLMHEADSTEKDILNKIKEIKQNNGNYFASNKIVIENDSLKPFATPTKIQIEDIFSNNITRSMLNIARSNVSSVINYSQMAISDLEYKESNYVAMYCEWYKKFSLSFACLVLLFVGCSMGAIVRKGRFGVPILIAVLYFVVFHVLNVIGEKLAKNMVIPPFAGMWLASLILMPLALFLTYKANRDSVIFRGEWYSNIYSNLKKLSQQLFTYKNRASD